MKNAFTRRYELLDITAKKKVCFFLSGAVWRPHTAKVMWGVDDEIRELLKTFRRNFVSKLVLGLILQVETLFGRIDETVFKKEKVRFPMLLENLTQDEWKTVMEGSNNIGSCLLIMFRLGNWQSCPCTKIGENKKERRGDFFIHRRSASGKTDADTEYIPN